MGLWLDTCDDDLTPRAPLPGDTDVDVAIVGAGYTGLWTAYYLAVADPHLRIAVLEAHIAGFGASGRNGGWCSALFAADWPAVARAAVARAAGTDAAGLDGVRAMHRVLVGTVREVGAVATKLGIDCGYHLGGSLSLATTPAHVTRLRAAVEAEHALGFGEDDVRWLPAAEVGERLRVTGALGATYTPHCARIHPAKLVRGLARAVERLGVAVYEGTTALDMTPGRVHTAHGTVRAPVVLRATEGYTPSLAGQRRELLPLYSLMIATEPLPAAFWDDVGWSGAETVTDGRHLLIYAQRTADGRIAFGGRGAPYHWGSAVRPEFDVEPRVFDALTATLHELWPGTRGAAITHRWGGPLGVPRDWFPSVGLDRATGLAWAGGYVGDGVATSNLAGRTVADLVLRRDTELTRLPWVGHRSPRWEPEPLRWLGVNLTRRLAAAADAVEARTGRPARRATVLKRFTGG